MEPTAERVRKLFFANPMRMEVVRFKSRFINCTSNPKLNRALMVTVIIAYLCVVALIAVNRGEASQSGEAVGAFLIIQTVLMTLGVVMAGHGAIAAERDRRSWDLLQVAPISQAQIVMGKFQSLLVLIGMVSLAGLPAVALLMPLSTVALWSVLIGECISLSYGAAAAAFTLYLSARLRTANTVLAAAVASLVTVFIVIPLAVFTAISIAQLGNALADVLMIWHPFYVLVRMFFPIGDDLLPAVRHLCGFPQIAFYLLVTYYFLSASVKILNNGSRKQ